MSIKEQIKKVVERALYYKTDGRQKVSIPVVVEKPKDASHGDYSTSVALALAKKLNKSPREIANTIISEIRTSLIRANKSVRNKSIFEKVEAAGPGFINFYLSKDFFIENVRVILKNKHFGRNKSLKNQKVVVEYTDTNILKDFHIGHLMSNSIGESLSRIFEFQGANVKRACYQSDVGLHIAKAVWGKIKNSLYSWQDAYVFGSEKYEIDENVKKEIVELNKKIFERTDKTVNKIYDEGKKWSLNYFESIYKKLGTKFDYYFFESEVADLGKKIVENNAGKVFEKGDNGAIIFKGEKVGLHTRVFINSEGLPTYEAKDLGLAKFKYGKYTYDKSVIVTANEQNEYFKVMLAAMSRIFPELQKKTTHIGHGMLRLSEGKMSSRTGRVITFESLLGNVEELVHQKIEGRELPEGEKKGITEKVAIGALKYSILKQSVGSDIVYDFEKSISFEGDSGPYLQYSYARAQSVLKKAKAEKVKASLKNIAEVTQLEKLMHYFPEVIEKAGKEYEPHIITLYLTELAREFSNYYANNKIVDKTDKFSPYKVALTQAFSIIMKNGLWLLGIPVLEKM